VRLIRQLATLVQLALAGIIGGAAWDGVQFGWRAAFDPEVQDAAQQLLLRSARLSHLALLSAARTATYGGRAAVSLVLEPRC